MSDIVVYTDFGPESPTIQPNDRDDSSCKEPEKAADVTAASDCFVVERAISNVKNYGSDDNSIKSADIENLSIGDKKLAKKDEESRDDIVKLQNQKNKSQSNFFPKFLSSSKDNSSKAAKDTKKSLNFFRRNKSTSSPTHTPNPPSNLESDSDN